MSDGSSDTTPPLPPSQTGTEKTRTKKWAPKTFNGCLTCKKRRIKCDEGKPECQRCIRSNLKCSGYAPPKIKLFEPTSSSSQSPAPITTSPTPPVPATAPTPFAATAGPTSSILPFDYIALAGSIRSSPPPTSADPLPYSFYQSGSFPPRPSSGPNLGTPEEVEAFQHYLTRTAPLLSAYTHPYIWKNLLPRLSQQHAPIKHSILALALMHQTLLSMSNSSRRPSLQSNLSSTSSSSEPTETQFIGHYNTAIRSLITAEPPTPIVLVSCLIFWALETFNGRALSSGVAPNPAAGNSHMRAAIRILGEWKSRRAPDDPHVDLITNYIEPMIRRSVWFARRDAVEEMQVQLASLTLTAQDYRIVSLDLPLFQDLGEAKRYLQGAIQDILAIQSWDAETTSQERLQSLDARICKWLYLFQGLIATGSVAERRTLIINHITALFLLEGLQRKQDDPDEAIVASERHRFITSEVEDMADTDLEGLAEACQDGEPVNLVSPLCVVALTAADGRLRRRAIDLLRRIESLRLTWTAELAANVAEVSLDASEYWGVECNLVRLRDMKFACDISNKTIEIGWRPSMMNSQHYTRVIRIPGGIDLTTQDLPKVIRNFMYTFE